MRHILAATDGFRGTVGCLCLKWKTMRLLVLPASPSALSPLSASVRHQATDRAFGKQVPCDAAKDPLAETAVSVRAGDEQVGVFILRDPD